jgi:eukaryotic-like serine/threonine-protein kinase
VKPPDKQDKPDDKKRPPAARTGQITIVTFPAAKVFRGKTELGSTPLFNAELPYGTHLLTLVGPDGAKHVLSVRIADAKNTPIKVKLDELPSR